MLGCSFSPSGVCFSDRKLAAIRAYHEWLPIRQVETDDKLRIWRNFKVGKLMDLTMLDTRLYDRDLTDLYYNTEFVNSISSFQNRSIMGKRQEEWFFNTLSESKSRSAVWRIVGQQVIFNQLNYSFFDMDSWDGYRANRFRVLDHIRDNHIDNVVVLSGDSHSNWAFDLSYPNDTTTYNSTTGDGSFGVEFGGTAVSSPAAFGFGITPQAADNISTLLVASKGNEDLQWSEASFRGFYTLTVGCDSVKTSYYAMANVTFSNLDAFISANFTVEAGGNKLSRPVAGGSVMAGRLKSDVLRELDGRH